MAVIREPCEFCGSRTRHSDSCPRHKSHPPCDQCGSRGKHFDHCIYHGRTAADRYRKRQLAKWHIDDRVKWTVPRLLAFSTLFTQYLRETNFKLFGRLRYELYQITGDVRDLPDEDWNTKWTRDPLPDDLDIAQERYFYDLVGQQMVREWGSPLGDGNRHFTGLGHDLTEDDEQAPSTALARRHREK
jgi:hypothetical protein